MRTVLVLDDDEDLLETVSGLLEDDGLSVCAAQDSSTALAKLASLPIGVIVMDYAVPAPAHGEAFLNAKAADPRIAGVPVILMSGYRLDRPLPGTTVVLPKPFDAQTLLSTVRRLLASTGGQDDG